MKKYVIENLNELNENGHYNNGVKENSINIDNQSVEDIENNKNIDDLVCDTLSDLCYKYVEEYGFEDEEDINSGSCELFADEFIELMYEKDKTINVVKMSTCDFTSNELLNNGTLFSKEKIENYFGYKFSDELIEKMIKANPGYHVWLYINNKYYDSECTEGVASPFNLPFFERSFYNID